MHAVVPLDAAFPGAPGRSARVGRCRGSTLGSDATIVYGTPASTFEQPTVPDLPREHFIEGVWGPSEVGPGLRFYGCELLLVVDRLQP